MRIEKRRRRENKTDYKNRLNILKKGTPRIVFRKTNKYLIAQYIESKEAKDKVIFGFNTKDLIGYGWPKEFSGSLKSIPAAYLLGYLMSKEIIKSKLEKPIVDFGMIRMIYKTKTYAFLKGLIDAGLKIPCKEKTFPEEKRIHGENLKKKNFSTYFQEIKSKIDKK